MDLNNHPLDNIVHFTPRTPETYLCLYTVYFWEVSTVVVFPTSIFEGTEIEDFKFQKS